MKLAMPDILLALIRNGLAMGQHYRGACRENRKPETGPDPVDPPSVLSLISPSSPKQLGMVSPELLSPELPLGMVSPELP